MHSSNNHALLSFGKSRNPGSDLMIPGPILRKSTWFEKESPQICPRAKINGQISLAQIEWAGNARLRLVVGRPAGRTWLAAVDIECLWLFRFSILPGQLVDG